MKTRKSKRIAGKSAPGSCSKIEKSFISPERLEQSKAEFMNSEFGPRARELLKEYEELKKILET